LKGIVSLADEKENNEDELKRIKAETLMNEIKVNLKYMPVEYQEQFRKTLKELNLDEDFNEIEPTNVEKSEL
jgi:hypothetical protein